MISAVFWFWLVLVAHPSMGGWNIRGNLGATHPIPDNLINSATNAFGATYTFTHSTAKFMPQAALTSTGIFPDSCVSSDLDNPFGWQRWRNELLQGVTIDLIEGTIRITLASVSGFATIGGEVVTCGPFLDRDGNPLYRNILPSQDTFMTFSIVSTTTQPLIELSLDGHPRPLTEIPESVLRFEGIRLSITLLYDVWNASRVQEIAARLLCTPVEVNCFDGIVQPHHFSVPANQPNVVRLDVPREESRHFNIKEITTPKKADTIIRFDLDGFEQESRLFSYKGRRITSTAEFRVVESSTVPDLSITWRLPNVPTWDDTFLSGGIDNQASGIVEITEDCLRGKIFDSTCQRTLTFRTPQQSDQPQLFTLNVHTIEDIRRYAFTSTFMDFANLDWVAAYEAEPTTGKVAAVRMHPVPMYDAWDVDDIAVTLPYTVFTTQEPPRLVPDPLLLRVSPSSGVVWGITRDIEQRDIAQGGIVFEFWLDGESFTQAALDNFVSLMVAVNVTDAWERMKESCVLPPGSVQFGRTPWGTENYSSIIASFQPCPDFETEYSDYVNVMIEDVHVRSSQPLLRSSNPGLGFEVIKSPGTLLFRNESNFHEAKIRDGGQNFSFDLQLLTERWPREPAALQTCFELLCDSWTSDVPLGTKDADAWSSPARRNAICGADGSAFTKLTERIVRFVGYPDPDYNTRTGEEILVVVPGECALSGKPLDGNQTLVVRPQSGFVSFNRINNDTHKSDSTIADAEYPRDFEEITEISEHALRSGGFAIVVYNRLDNFDDDPATTAFFASQIRDSLQSVGSEAFGFNKKKLDLIDNVTIYFDRVAIWIRGTMTYDIAENETLQLTFSNEWMSSKALPDPVVLNLTVYASAGTVEVTDWYGASQPVTEEDLRFGRLWFEFRLIGDQWRRERVPFVEIWTGDLPDVETVTFGTGIATLIPELSFFNFSVSPLGFEFLRLQLQANEDFDIARRETVEVTFGNTTIASGIPPLFPGRNADDIVTTWAFAVEAVPGRVVLSGSTRGMNEKALRRSTTIVWYLTLVGETWAANASDALVRGDLLGAYNAAGTTPPEGFVAYKTALLPTSRATTPSPILLQMVVSPNRRFEIQITEVVTFRVVGELVASGLAPTVARPLEVPVVPTGGELRLVAAPDITEEDLRTRNFTVEIALDGDEWDSKLIVQERATFLDSAFSSQSPVIQAPRGFLANKRELLRLDTTPDVAEASGTLTIRFYPSPAYDIDDDETITFSVTRPEYLSEQSAALPDPNTVSFVVRSVGRIMIAVINPNLDFTATFESQPVTFQSLVASLLITPAARVAVSVNATSRRPEDRLLVMRISFEGASSLRDPRTPAQLADTMLALDSTYLFEQLGVRYLYFEDAPPSPEILFGDATAAPGLDTAADEADQASDNAAMWIVAAAVFIAAVAAVFVFCMKRQRQHLSLGVMRRDDGKQATQVAGGGEAQLDEVLKAEGLVDRDREYQAKYTSMRRREHIQRLFRQGRHAEARQLQDEGLAEEWMGEQQSTLSSSGVVKKSQSLAPPAKTTSAPAPIVAQLSTGQSVRQGMDLRDYVRRTRLGDVDDGLGLSPADILRSRYEQGSDDGDNDRAPSVHVSTVGVLRRLNEYGEEPTGGTGQTGRYFDASATEARLQEQLPATTIDRDRSGQTEEELAALRASRRGEGGRRDTTMMDALMRL